MYFNSSKKKLYTVTNRKQNLSKSIIVRNITNHLVKNITKCSYGSDINMFIKNDNYQRKKVFHSKIYFKGSLINNLHTNNTRFENGNFWNLSFDKGRIKTLVSWFLKNYGQKKTIQLVENLKNTGFEYATKAGISLGIEDLKISPNKAVLIAEAEKQTYEVITQYKRAQITGVERFQRLIDTWHRTSENLKQEVINYFEVTDLLNPVYMMAFSGARGNISQVRQLVGMRGLMADPKGQILDFPIRSNFREGLTLTEYLISSYGARKGIVDTALRTANAGYLTRRLVDVAQHVIVSHYDCGTKKGILITDMKEGTKLIYSLQHRIIGRVLAQDIYSLTGKIASRNAEISSELAIKIAKASSKVLIRSALTCETRKLICQLCYGWSLGQGKLVSIGDAVGVIAAQSIGEPGTQLTMRTFHTGGVFSSDVNDQILGPYDGTIQYSSFIPGTLVRTPQGKIAFLSKAEGSFLITNVNQSSFETEQKTKFFKIPPYTLLFCRHNEKVYFKQVVAQICSSSTQNKQRDDAEQSIQTELQGQVYMDHLTLIEQTNDYGDTNQQSWDWGYIWILSGKIYEISVDSYIFPQFGDFVTKNSILNEIQWMSSDKAELNITLKNPSFPLSVSITDVDNYQSMFQIFNKKFPNKQNQQLLYNTKFLNPIHFSRLDIDRRKQKLYNQNLQSAYTWQQRLILPDSDHTSRQGKGKKHNLQLSQIVKEKFHNILFLKHRSDNSLFEQFRNTNKHRNVVDSNQVKISNTILKATSLPFSGSMNRIGEYESILERNHNLIHRYSTSISPNSSLTIGLAKTNFSSSKSLKFKRPLLLFDTHKFMYKKIGYFFKINLPRLMNKFDSKNTYYKSVFISQNDKFFIPVNLQSSTKIFTTTLFRNSTSQISLANQGNLENSFDWKIFPNILLTWFPSLYQNKNASFTSYEIPELTQINLEEAEYFLLKKKNSSFYSRLQKKIVQFPLKNLNYNQIIYNKYKSNDLNYTFLKYSDIDNLIYSKTKNYRNLWLFSEKQENYFLKMYLTHFSFDSTQFSQHLKFKRYSELRWKNSKIFSNKEFLHRGRVFTIPHQIYKFIGLEKPLNRCSFFKEKQLNFNSLNWKTNDSVLYYNFTRQGKQIPVFINVEGFVQIYKNSIFSQPVENIYNKNENYQLNMNYKKTNLLSSSKNSFLLSSLTDSVHTSRQGKGSRNRVGKESMSLVDKHQLTLQSKNNPVLPKATFKLVPLTNKKIFQSLKQYNKQYYVALKFKMLKMNLNHIDMKKVILFMNQKNYKKLIFLKSPYLNKNSIFYTYEIRKKESFIETNLSLLNSVKLTNVKNANTISSMFKFSFLNLNSYLEKQFIFNKVKSKLSHFALQIQSGWVYIPTKLTSNIIKYHKSIIPVGKVLVDDISVPSQLVYLECIIIKALFLKYNINFLNLFSSFNFSEISSSKKTIIYQLIKKRHNIRLHFSFENFSNNIERNFPTGFIFSNSVDPSLVPKRKEIFSHNKSVFQTRSSINFSSNNLKWIRNMKLRNNFVISDHLNNFNLGSKITLSSFNSEFLDKNKSLSFNIPKLTLNSEFSKKSEFYVLLVIKKVNEYNIQEISYYKNNLYTSQINNFNTNFSRLLKQKYHTTNLNKQFKNFRLISQFPNIDLRLESVFKVSSILKNQNLLGIIGPKKFIKSNYLNVSVPFNFKKILFYNKSSSFLYFKLHFITNSTFEMNSKKPFFSFNYLNAPNFSTFFSSSLNLMYKHILNYSLAKVSNFSSYPLSGSMTDSSFLSVLKFSFTTKKLVSELLNLTLIFSVHLSKLFSTPLFDFSLSQRPVYFLDNRFFVKPRLNKLFSTSHIENVGLSTTSQNFSNSLLIPFSKVKNSYIFKLEDQLLPRQAFAYSSFLSPYEGELLLKNKQNWNTTFQKNRLIILTKNDLVSFNLKNVLFSSTLNLKNSSLFLEQVQKKNNEFTNNLNISSQTDLFIQAFRKLYKIDNLQVRLPELKNVCMVGQFIYYGDQVNTTLAIPQAGQVVHLSAKKLTPNWRLQLPGGLQPAPVPDVPRQPLVPLQLVLAQLGALEEVLLVQVLAAALLHDVLEVVLQASCGRHSSSQLHTVSASFSLGRSTSAVKLLRSQ